MIRLAWAAVAVGATVLAGWYAQVPELTAVGSHWPTTKPITAVCLMFSGALVGLGEAPGKGAAVARSALTMWLTLFVLTAIWALSSHTPDAFWSVFVTEADGATESTRPGVPSLVTLGSFAAVTGLGWASIWGHHSHHRAVGLALVFSALTSLLFGYALDLELGRYYVEGVSTGYALPTAIGFLCVGFGCLAAPKST